MEEIKLQIRLKKGTLLYTHFKGILDDRAEEGRHLMRTGLLAGSLERVCLQTIREGMADLSIVAAPPVSSGDGVENPAARATVESALEGFNL